MPDINTAPRSPRGVLNSHGPSVTPAAHPGSSQSASRRTSTQMLPPPLPQNNSLPNSPRPAQASMMDNTGVGLGPGQPEKTICQRSSTEAIQLGPIRHPRPLTAAELHLELEKEQESIVSFVNSFQRCCGIKYPPRSIVLRANCPLCAPKPPL